MRRDEILAVVEDYRTNLQRLGVQAKHFPKDKTVQDPEVTLNHAMSMLPKIRELAESGQSDEATERLKFIQGMFVANGICTIDEARLNKPLTIL